MTHCACRGKAGRCVGGIIGGGVILLVARVTCTASQVVVVVDVAIRALPGRYGVRSGQRKTSTRMVKLAMGPEHGIVAASAGGRERSMGNGRGGGSIVFLEAGVTRRGSQEVVGIDMAI